MPWGFNKKSTFQRRGQLLKDVLHGSVSFAPIAVIIYIYHIIFYYYIYIYLFIILYIYYVIRYGHIQFEHDKTYQKHPNRNSFIKSIYLDPPEANVAWSGLWEAFEGSRCCTSVQMRTVPSVPSESSAHDFHDQWEIFRIQLMEVR